MPTSFPWNKTSKVGVQTFKVFKDRNLEQLRSQSPVLKQRLDTFDVLNADSCAFKEHRFDLLFSRTAVSQAGNFSDNRASRYGGMNIEFIVLYL